jgi:hypothetical protein
MIYKTVSKRNKFHKKRRHRCVERGRWKHFKPRKNITNLKLKSGVCPYCNTILGGRTI